MFERLCQIKYYDDLCVPQRSKVLEVHLDTAKECEVFDSLSQQLSWKEFDLSPQPHNTVLY